MKPLPCLLALTLLLSSCFTHRVLYIHTPDKINTPCFTKKGDVRLDVSAQFNSKDSSIGSPASFSADAGYAITNHLGIIASYRGIDSRAVRHTMHPHAVGPLKEVQHFLLNGYRFDAGAGYYCELSRHSVIEAFGCLGAGSIRNTSGFDDPGYYKANFVNGSAQFDFNLNYDLLSFSFGNRLSLFKYYELNHTGNTLLNDADYPITDQTFTYYTPFVQLALGYRYIKANMQAGIELGWGDGGDKSYYRPSAGYLTLGLSFQLNTLSLKHAQIHDEGY